MKKGFLLLLLTVSILLWTVVVQAEVLEHISFSPSSAASIAGMDQRQAELEIDSSLSITWDQPAFLSDLTHKLKIAPQGESLAPRIEALKGLIDRVIDLQRLLIIANRTSLALNRAKTTGQGDMDSLGQQFEEANAALSAAGVPLLTELRQRYKTTNPDLYKMLSGAILAEDYQPLADVLQEEADRIGTLLAERIAQSGQVEIQMIATLTGTDGVARPVHLDGYDRYEAVSPVPFNRFQMTTDERALKDLAAAETMAEMIKKQQSGALGEEADKALIELGETLHDLHQTLAIDVLVANLDQLLIVLTAAKDSNLGPMIEEVQDIRRLLSSIVANPNLPGSTDSQRLVALLGVIQDVTNRMEWLAIQAPSQFQKLVDDLEKELRRRPAMVRSDLVVALKDSLTQLKKSTPAIKAMLINAKSVLSALGLVSNLGEAIDQSLQQPRILLADANLDTRLDLQTIPGERHVGDHLNVVVNVLLDRTVIDSGSKSFQLEAYGPFVETRGALMLVDPQGDLPSGQDFEPAPGLAFNLHYGWKDSPFWNHIMRPGIGASLAMLDFDDTKSMEIGIGANITLFKDIFWVGYGYNLQAKVDYFYIGINPLVVGQLFSQPTGIRNK